MQKQKGVGIFIFCFAMIFIVIGAQQAASQSHRLATWPAVRATIHSRGIVKHASSDGTTWASEARYTYVVRGKEYECKQVTALKESASDSWAQGCIDLLPQGTDVTAYYNPNNPAEAFLLRRPAFVPYLFVLFPMIFIAIGLWLIYPPAKTLNRITTIWLAVGLVVSIHYLRLANPVELLAKVSLAIYGLIGLGMVFAIVRKKRNTMFPEAQKI